MGKDPNEDLDKLYSDRWARMMRRLRQGATAIDRMLVQPHLFEVTLTSVRIKLPEDSLGEYMVVLKGEHDDGPMVAFYKADSYEEAVTGALLSWENRSLKWREDRPFGG